MLHVSPEDPQSPAAIGLIAEFMRDLEERYERDYVATLFRPDQVIDGLGVFIVAWFGEQAVGCGALRPIKPGVGEIRRLYVQPSARGKGIGREILRELERRAGSFGFRELWLETGDRQPEAVDLLEKCGYARIAAFGPYVGHGQSVCLGKTLATEGTRSDEPAA